MTYPIRWMRLVCAPLVLLLGAPSVQAETLEQVLATTYTQNPRIQSARAKLESTDERVSQATAGFRPTVTANYLSGHQRTSVNGGDTRPGTSTNKNLQVEQPLFRGGGTFASLNSARQLVKAGQYDLMATEQQVLLDAVTAYMNVVSGRVIFDLASHNEKVLAEQLTAANVRFKVGEVTRTDVAQAQARLLDAKSARIAAQGQLLSDSAVFERVTGSKPAPTLETPSKLPELPATMDDALVKARDSNPQLLSAIHAQKSSVYDVGVSKSALLPSVSLVGTAGRQDGVGSTGNSSFDQDRVALQVTIPLYQAGAEYSRVRAAKALARSLDQDAIDARQMVDETVTEAWVGLENASATISARESQISAAELALEGVKQEHQFGTRTLLDALNAEQELFSARADLVRAQRDRVVAAYTLAFRLGQLSPDALGLAVTPYDAREHAGDVAWKPIGF